MNRKAQYFAAILDEFNLQPIYIRQKLDIIFILHFHLLP